MKENAYLYLEFHGCLVSQLVYDIVNISMGSSPEVALREYSGHYNGLRLLELEEERALGG